MVAQELRAKCSLRVNDAAAEESGTIIFKDSDVWFYPDVAGHSECESTDADSSTHHTLGCSNIRHVALKRSRVSSSRDVIFINGRGSQAGLAWTLRKFDDDQACQSIYKQLSASVMGSRSLTPSSRIQRSASAGSRSASGTPLRRSHSAREHTPHKATSSTPARDPTAGSACGMPCIYSDPVFKETKFCQSISKKLPKNSPYAVPKEKECQRERAIEINLDCTLDDFWNLFWADYCPRNFDAQESEIIDDYGLWTDDPCPRRSILYD